jgi:small-conductance mechanosensitive channel
MNTFRRVRQHRLRWAACWLFLFAPSVPAVAQEPEPQPPAGAPVVHHSDTLFLLYGAIGPFSAADRADALSRRITAIAEDPLLLSEQITVVDTAGAVDIRLDTLVVMTVTERDAATAGLTQADLAEQYAAEIRRVVEEGERPASLRSLLVGGLMTLGATIALTIVLILISRFFPVLYRWIQQGKGVWIRPLKIQRLELLSAAQAAEIVLFGARVLRISVIVVLIYFFLPAVFSFFPGTRGLANTLFNWTLGPLGRAWTAVVAYLPNLFTVAVLVVVFHYILKFIHLLFTGLRRGSLSLPGFYRDWAMPTYKIVRFLVIVFAAIVIFPYLPGSQTPAFRGISIFLGVLISFGSSSAIANVVAGVVMTYMRPFQIGDRVRISDTVGDVVEKTLLITRVRTTKNVDVTVPNAMVLSSHIINYSSTAKDGGVILHTEVTIGYDAPWRQVHQLLLAAADATADVTKEPKPFVLQTSLDDFYVSYELNAHTDKPNAMARIYSDLHQSIQDRFNEAGVEIMSPHYRAERDGNAVAIPPEHRPKGYTAPAFRIEQTNGGTAAGP